MTVGTKISSFVDVRCAGAEVHYCQPPRENIRLRLPEQIKRCVGFLSHAIANPKYLGTGFLVALRGKHDNAYIHLVTAAHVAELLDPGDWLFGMNGKERGKIWIKGGSVKWWYHPTERETVDCAVTIFASDRIEEYEIEYIPDVMFVTEEKIKQFDLGIGDEIHVVGLFTRFHGNERHVPIVRTGNVAMMPSERVPVAKNLEMEVYLAEGRSIGGLSGSPVFIRESLNTAMQDGKGQIKGFMGQGQLHFLGLMRGHWETETLPAKVQQEQVEAVNMGISVVVPAQKIWEVLHHPELVQMRKDFDDDIERGKYPVTDKAKAKEEAPQVFTQSDFEDALKKASRKIAPEKK